MFNATKTMLGALNIDLVCRHAAIDKDSTCLLTPLGASLEFCLAKLFSKTKNNETKEGPIKKMRKIDLKKSNKIKPKKFNNTKATKNDSRFGKFEDFEVFQE